MDKKSKLDALFDNKNKQETVNEVGPSKDEIIEEIFKEDDEVTEQPNKKPTKKPKKKKVVKKKSKKKKKEKDVRERNVFVYKNKKFKNVTEFTKYLDEHYLLLDDIANDVLKDPVFLGWIKKRSEMFDQSIERFKQIKGKIDK